MENKDLVDALVPVKAMVSSGNLGGAIKAMEKIPDKLKDEAIYKEVVTNIESYGVTMDMFKTAKEKEAKVVAMKPKTKAAKKVVTTPPTKAKKKVEKKPPVTASFKKVIQAHLTEKGKNDMAFQARLDLKDKNIDDCIQYILNKVKASGANGFMEAEIYGMAAHYYDEDKVKVGAKTTVQRVVVNHKAEEKPTKPKNSKIKSVPENQTSMF